MDIEKKLFELPLCDVKKFEIEDILTTSGEGEGDNWETPDL